MISFVKGTLQQILFILWSCCFYVIFLPLDIKRSYYHTDFGLKFLKFYIVGASKILRLVGGYKEVVSGEIPTTPVLIASRHESMWETLSFNYILERPPSYVVKHEILKLPFWGRYIQRFGNIMIDRASKGATLLKIIKQAKVAIKRKRSIVIFPEATRMTGDQRVDLKLEGVYGCYKLLNLPLVAVSLNSSKLWPKGGMPTKRGGVISCHFAKPLKQGKSIEEVAKYLEDNMVAPSIRLHQKTNS